MGSSTKLGMSKGPGGAVTLSQQTTSTIKLVSQPSNLPPPPSVPVASSSSKVPQAKSMASSNSNRDLENTKQPAQVWREQNQARVRAELRAQDVAEGGIDENADLPDIRSECVSFLASVASRP